MTDRRAKFGWASWIAGLAMTIALCGVMPAWPQSAGEVERLEAEVRRHYGTGNFVEAADRAREVLALKERTLGPAHPDVVTALNNLAQIYAAQGLYDAAEPFWKRALSILETAKGPSAPATGVILGNLGGLYLEQGRYAEAEPLYKRSIDVLEDALGPTHQAVGTALNNLGELFRAQHRFVDAEPLLKRALAVREQSLEAGHPEVGQSLGNLAELYRTQARHAEAEPLYRRSIAILEKALGPSHPDVATSLNNLALSYRAKLRDAEAEPLLQRTAQIYEAALGARHPAFATALHNLARLQLSQQRWSEADALFERSLSIRQSTLGADHPDVAASLANRAFVAMGRDDMATAADLWRRAAAILQRRAARENGAAGVGGASAGRAKDETHRKGWIFEGLIKARYRSSSAAGFDAQAIAAEMFEIAQWAVSSEAASALAQMAARSTGGSTPLSNLVRERQDLVGNWQVGDAQMTAERSKPPAQRDGAAERALADRLSAIDANIAAIDARLTREFPQLAALATPSPIAVSDVQAMLHADEALVLLLDTSAFAPLPEETFVWIVTRSDVRWLRSELGMQALDSEVTALRCGLDRGAWIGEGGLRCAKLLHLPPGHVPADDEPLPFDAARAHSIYRGLFGPAADLLRGKQLLLVPNGTLTTLPFQVLVSEPPPSGDLAAARWLVRDHAITVLPAAASLKALRGDAAPSRGDRPIIGFGNPLLDGDQSHPRYGEYFRQQAEKARSRSGCAATADRDMERVRKVARSPGAALKPATGLLDLGALRAQTPLPETADELCEVVRSVDGTTDEVRLGARATEAEVKRLSSTGELARHRIVHFATHGVLAGQLAGVVEPGLILTPPDNPTAQDDGYLSAGEIASLKLDAEWVILSACNTAGAADAETAEALSGLARVFFYAGARALLVSHWEVDSDAAVKLVTATVAVMSNDKTLGRAEALRRAMLTVMTDPTRPVGWVPGWHPSVWAPFAVVGEGRRG